MGPSLLLDLLFPPKCAFCGRLLEEGGAECVCPVCRADLPFREEAQILREVDGFPCAVALYYDGTVESGVHALKFEGKSWRAAVFARYIVQAVTARLDIAFDAVTFVPVSPQRRFTRGYDQAQLLAQASAELLRLPVERTLRKVRHNRAQSTLEDPLLRQENVRGAYRVLRPEAVSDRRFLLLDDVCTTGSTIAACARELTRAGAQSVVCAALAGGHGAKTGE